MEGRIDVENKSTFLCLPNHIFLHSCLSVFQNQNGSSYEVPLPLLIPYQLNPSQLRYNDLCEGGVSSLADSSHPREVFQPGPSQLTFCPGRCSFSFLSLCSNSCALFTRSRLSVHGPRLLLEETQPLGQCNSQGTLPHDIFLGKKDSCKFLVEIRVADLVEGIQSHGRGARRSSAIFNLKRAVCKVLVCVCVCMCVRRPLVFGMGIGARSDRGQCVRDQLHQSRWQQCCL